MATHIENVLSAMAEEVASLEAVRDDLDVEIESLSARRAAIEQRIDLIGQWRTAVYVARERDAAEANDE